MYLRAFEQQTIADAQTLPLTHLQDRACCLCTEANKSNENAQ